MENRDGLSLACPACNETFEVPPPGEPQEAPESTEFRSLTAGTLGQDIGTCPRCGYTDWLEGMSAGADPAPVSEEVQKQVAEAVGSYGPPSSWSTRQRYRAAARVSEAAGRPKSARALFELRIAWAAEDDGDADRAEVWRREAAETLLGALDEGEVGEEDQLPVTYLAAEMLRRAGDRERASEMFGKLMAEAHESDDPLVNRLLRLASMQVTQPSEVLPDWF